MNTPPPEITRDDFLRWRSPLAGTATPVGDSLILIGNLGHPDDRRPVETQALRLELDSWRISPVETSGTPPCWIHGHRAELSEDGKAIRITGGKIDVDDSGSLPENIHDWSLELESGLWSCTNRRNWRRFEFRRKDEKWLRLWDLRNRLMMRKLGMEEKPGFLVWLSQLLVPPPDPALLETLYTPPVASEIVPQKSLLETVDGEEDEYGVYRIRIGDVVVRYVEDSVSIFMTIEGELPPESVKELKKDLTAKLARLERVRIVCREFE